MTTYIKTTMTVKMEKSKLTEAEIAEVRAGWKDLEEDARNDAPPGAIVELKIEEVEE